MLHDRQLVPIESERARETTVVDGIAPGSIGQDGIGAAANPLHNVRSQRSKGVLNILVIQGLKGEYDPGGRRHHIDS